MRTKIIRTTAATLGTLAVCAAGAAPAMAGYGIGGNSVAIDRPLGPETQIVKPGH